MKIKLKPVSSAWLRNLDYEETKVGWMDSVYLRLSAYAKSIRRMKTKMRKVA